MQNVDEQIISLTEELIRFRTTANRPEELHRCADFLAQQFVGTPFAVQRFDNAGTPSLFISRAGQNRPHVLLYGHFDVVEADDAQFVPQRDADFLFGRGALDMKSGIAVFVMLMKTLTETKHDVGLMLVGDEESGGFHGTKFLLENGFGGDVVVMPDGGLQIDRVVTKEKGVLHIKLVAVGQSAHGAYPWHGVNAIDRLRRAMSNVEGLFTAVADHPDDHWVNTFSVGRIHGGVNLNSVPSAAEAYLDIRLTEHDTIAAFLEKIHAVLPEGVDVVEMVTSPTSLYQADHPLVAPYFEVLQERGYTPQSVVSHGGSDARFFAGAGMPVIVSQPAGDGHHSASERVSMRAVGEYYGVVLRYIEALGSKKQT